MHPRARDITGQRFGRLMALAPTALRSRNSVVWRFECDCGEVAEKALNEITTGKVTSCGCLRSEMSTDKIAAIRGLGALATVTHGKTNTATYRIWRGMIQRCRNPKSKDYANYGGRGIKVCDRWVDSFEAFLEDMGERPAGLQIERDDNDGHYEPANCRWATIIEQSRNKRSNRLIAHAGKTQTIKQWAHELGVSHQAIGYRLRQGWSVRDALTTPFNHANGWIRGIRK
ncbi:MAG: hypothetical protein DI537_14535 [Stutzerimonas stutzeri]|nr:MAG: hypothetical protein DI537_14535 [Stutzerimonas stutzeri]